MHGIRPVKNLKQPLYPDKTIALADPALLQKLPERWANCKKAAVAAGLLTTMAVSLAACTPVKPINGSDSTTSFIANSDAISSAALSGTNSSLPAGVPLPPEIVTENDALAIIKNAADRLFANAQPYEMKDIKKPVEYIHYDVSSKTFLKVAPVKAEIEPKIDMYDAGKNIGFEYLSDELKEGKEPSAYSPAGVDIEQTDKQNAYVLVLDEAYIDGQTENAMLREQIDAFIAWLKAESII